MKTGDDDTRGGIDVQAEAARMMRTFGQDAGLYMADWLSTYSPEEPMARILRLVEAEVQSRLVQAGLG